MTHDVNRWHSNPRGGNELEFFTVVSEEERDGRG